MEGYDYVSNKHDRRDVKPVIQESPNSGISIRSIKEVFEQVKILEALSTKRITVSCSFLQIYNEKVYDLLNFGSIADKKSKGLKIRWNKESQFTVENLFICNCQSPQDAIDLYNEGIQNKIVASHKMNHASSRSHCIFTVNLEIVDT